MTDDEIVFSNVGICPICESSVRFVARHAWFRDHYRCEQCQSIPRERALMRCIQRCFPNYRELVVHESSPNPRGASPKLAAECKRYIASQWHPDAPSGSVRDGVRCENLEALSFGDAEIDLHVTQDVLEHVLDPDAVFRELARTLRPGGAHVFTVPLVARAKPSFVRAERRPDGAVVHHVPPKYHDNPVDPNGSLVTVDWGYDVCERILRSSGLLTRIIEIDDIEHGIRADLNEVLISMKPAACGS